MENSNRLISLISNNLYAKECIGRGFFLEMWLNAVTKMMLLFQIKAALMPPGPSPDLSSEVQVMHYFRKAIMIHSMIHIYLAGFVFLMKGWGRSLQMPSRGWGDAQHSRALATLLEDQGLGPSTYAGRLRTACNSSCRGSCCFWPLQAPSCT